MMMRPPDLSVRFRGVCPPNPMSRPFFERADFGSRPPLKARSALGGGTNTGAIVAALVFISPHNKPLLAFATPQGT